MRNRGFTVAELLFTLALTGVLAGIGVVAYRNIQERSQEAVTQRDQVVLQQVMESFRMSGGNMAPILAADDNVLPPAQKAAALTRVLQSNNTADARKLGQNIQRISADMVIVPFTAANGEPVLVANADRTSLIVTSQPGNDDIGYRVVRRTSILGQQAPAASSDAIAAANQVLNPSIIGASYALGSNYLWNEDASTASSTALASDPNAVNPGTQFTGMPGNVELSIVAVTQKNGSWVSAIGNYSYNEYQGPNPLKVTFFVFRKDGKPLLRQDVSTGSAGVYAVGITNTPQAPHPVSSVTIPASVARGLGTKVQGLSFEVAPSSIFAFPANYDSLSNPISFVLTSAAVPTSEGLRGRPGVAPLAPGRVMSGNVNIWVSKPSTLKVAYLFDKTGDGTGRLTKATKPVKTGPDMNMDSGIIIDEPGEEVSGPSSDAVSYLYRHYQFPRDPSNTLVANPTISGFPNRAVAYIGVYRDNGTAVAATDIAGLTVTYNGTNYAVDTTRTANVDMTSVGAPSGTVVYAFDLPAIADPQKTTVQNFDLKVSAITPTATAAQGTFASPSIVGLHSSAATPVTVAVTAKPSKLIVQRIKPDNTIASASENNILYATSDDYTNGPNKKLTIAVTREDGSPLRVSDVAANTSKFLFNSNLLAAAGLNGNSSFNNPYTIGGVNLIGGQLQNEKPLASNTRLLYNFLPSVTVSAAAWSGNPQAQLQFFIQPSAAAMLGDKDREALLAPTQAWDSNPLTANATNVGRIFIYAGWLGGKIPTPGAPSSTVPVSGGGKDMGSVRGPF